MWIKWKRLDELAKRLFGTYASLVQQVEAIAPIDVGMDDKTFQNYRKAGQDGRGKTIDAKVEKRLKLIYKVLTEKDPSIMGDDIIELAPGEKMPEWANAWKKLSTTDLARLLDREPQWGTLSRVLNERRNGCLLLWGDEFQYLSALLERLVRVPHWHINPLPPHQIIPVGLGRGASMPPATRDAWNARFEDGIEEITREPFKVAFFREQNRPQVFLLGEDAPVPEDFTPDIWKALGEFLTGDFLKWCDASSGARLWVLIPMLCHSTDSTALARRDAIREAISHPLKFEDSRLELPKWPQLESFIRYDFTPKPGHPRPDSAKIAAIEERFTALKQRRADRLSFEDIATFLYNELY